MHPHPFPIVLASLRPGRRFEYPGRPGRKIRDPTDSGDDRAPLGQLAPHGALTIQLTGGERYDPPDPAAPAQSAIVSVELFIVRVAGGGTNWPSTVKWSTNVTATSFSAPSSSRLDTYLLVYLPNLQYWLGHIISQGYGAAGS